MDFNFITEYFIPVVLVACLLVGYILKMWIKDLENRYIPSLLALVGAILTCLANGGITIENIVYGAVAGLASTGLHQAFRSFIERKEG